MSGRASVARITTHPLTPERWSDLEAVFAGKGCSFARACWCMAYRETGRPVVPPGARLADVRKARLRALAAGAPAPGLVVFLIYVWIVGILSILKALLGLVLALAIGLWVYRWVARSRVDRHGGGR
ncbi:MAG: hypothetical protein FJX67_04635 [Alphaproteobacteria bacterium]|nr:hypothetical protein [Alphaproteobacteria bacterium]